MPWIPNTVISSGSSSAASDPVFDKFGNPDTAFEFETSSLAGLTATSQTADVADADTTVPGCLYFRDDNNGSTSVCGYYASGLTAPFTAITKIADHNLSRNFTLSGLFVGVGTPGAMYGIGPGLAGPRMFVVAYTNPTTQGGSTESGDNLWAPLWLAMRVNSNTDVDLLWCTNGQVWFEQLSAQNPGFSPVTAGVMLNNNAAVVSAIAYDYLRIWNSALVMPGAV